ncbi:hypothetical protein TKK_0005588 [Trichogramma kaykai]
MVRERLQDKNVPEEKIGKYMGQFGSKLSSKIMDLRPYFKKFKKKFDLDSGEWLLNAEVIAKYEEEMKKLIEMEQQALEDEVA